VFLAVGGWLISAVENTLIRALELPIAVEWVWVVFDEIATGFSLIGGIIDMAAVAVHVWYSSRSEVWSRQQVNARATQPTSAASPAPSARGGRGLFFASPLMAGLYLLAPTQEQTHVARFALRKIEDLRREIESVRSERGIPPLVNLRRFAT
jgi:hypothetical protein